MNKAFIFFMLLILTACSALNNQQGQQPVESRGGLVENNEGTKPDDMSFREGDMTDIADINPNFLDLNSENEAHNNHGAYQEKLRDIVENSEAFNAGMIYINGDKAIVNVTPTQNFAKDELAKLKGALENELCSAVPRYNIEVRINE